MATDTDQFQPTEEQLAEARRIMAADAANRAAQDAARREAEAAPAKEIAAIAGFEDVLAKISDLRTSTSIDLPIFNHLQAAFLGLSAIKTAAAA